MRNTIIIILFLLFFSSCFLNTWDNSLILTNQTNDTLLFDEQEGTLYDTVPPLINCDKGLFDDVCPNSMEHLSAPFKWKYGIDSFKRVVHIYLFSPDSVRKYGKCEILKQRNYIKRLDLNHDALENCNYNITINKTIY